MPPTSAGGVSFRNVATTLFRHPIRSFTAGFNRLNNVFGGRRVVSGVVPFGPAGAGVSAVEKAGGALSRGTKGIINLFQRATTNPIAGAETVGAGLRGFAKTAFGRALGVMTLWQAVNLAKSGVTGEPVKLFKNVKEAGLIGAASGLNPIGSVIGVGLGALEKGTDYAKGKIFPNTSYPGQLDEGDLLAIQKQFKDTIPINFSVGNFPGMPTMAPITITTPTPGGISFSPSVNAGSGMDPLMLMLLLGGAGLGAGYLIGKKKRKSKRYKKRRK